MKWLKFQWEYLTRIKFRLYYSTLPCENMHKHEHALIIQEHLFILPTSKFDTILIVHKEKIKPFLLVDHICFFDAQITATKFYH